MNSECLLSPKISIITAVYNRENFVGNSLNSLQSQTWHNIEHIIIDGASTDGTLSIINSKMNASTVVISEKDKGIYDALNKGLRIASGDVIGFLHSDDFYSDEHVLEKIAKAFSNPAIDGVYGDLDYISKIGSERVIRHWHSGSYHPNKVGWGWMPPHPTLYLRKRVIEQYGPFDTAYQISADYDAILRYLVKGKIRLEYIPDVLVKMRMGGESNRSLSRILHKSYEDYRALHSNGVGGIGVLFCKNMRKLSQFFNLKKS